MKFDKLVEDCLEQYSQKTIDESFGYDLAHSFIQGATRNPQTRDLLFKFFIGQIHPEMAFTMRYAIYLAVSAILGGGAALGVYAAHGALFNDIIDATKEWVLKKFGKTIKKEDTNAALKQANKLLYGPNTAEVEQIINKIIKTSKANDIEGFKKTLEELKKYSINNNS